jgi:hypothetical protein
MMLANANYVDFEDIANEEAYLNEDIPPEPLETIMEVPSVHQPMMMLQKERSNLDIHTPASMMSNGGTRRRPPAIE